MTDKMFDSFEIRDANGKLTNAGALLADNSPVRHSRLFCTRWNGLIHRDYLVLGSEVHIDMYDDRLTICSPGGIGTVPDQPTDKPADKPVDQPTDKPAVEKGDVLTSGKASYKVTESADGKQTVSYMGTTSTAKKLTIPAKVTIDGVTYKVTAIAKNAFKGIHKKAVIKVPKAKNKAYVKLIQKSGYKGTVN